MTTKHAPATPLPWHESGEELYGYDNSMVVDFATHDHAPADRSYIAHACNKYPDLVEALRKVVAQARQYPDNAAAVHVDAANLLRSLGEE